jgi:hypothetical protein
MLHQSSIRSNSSSRLAEKIHHRDLARQSRNQKNRNISRKAAKAAKKKKNYLSELGVLRALAGEISESEMFHVSEKFGHAAKTFKHSSTEFAERIAFDCLQQFERLERFEPASLIIVAAGRGEFEAPKVLDR